MLTDDDHDDDLAARNKENLYVIGGGGSAWGSESLLHVGSPPKRPIDEMRGDDSVETPPRHRKLKKVAVEEEVDDEGAWEPFAPVKKGRRETTTGLL